MMHQDSACLPQIYRQYVHMVRGQVRRLLQPHPNEADTVVDTVVHATFVRFWRRHRRHVPGEGTGEILWRLATQMATRKLSRRRALAASPRWRPWQRRPHAPMPAAAVPDSCLSYFAVACVGADDRLPSAAELQHVQSCMTCQRRLRAERAAVAAAAQLPLPGPVAALTPRPRLTHSSAVGWRNWAAVLAMLAVCLVGAALLPRRGPEEPLLQGSGWGQLSTLIRRADGVQRAVPVSLAWQSLLPGEVLRLHVAWPEAVRVQVQDAHTGAELYNGMLPSDGWLPLQISPPPPGSIPQWTVHLCPVGPEPSCWTRTLP